MSEITPKVQPELLKHIQQLHTSTSALCLLIGGSKTGDLLNDLVTAAYSYDHAPRRFESKSVMEIMAELSAGLNEATAGD